MDLFKKFKIKLNKKPKKTLSKPKLNVSTQGWNIKERDINNNNDDLYDVETETKNQVIYKPEFNISYELPKDLVQNQFILPDVGDNFTKTEDLDKINSELIALKSNIFIAEDLIKSLQFNIDDQVIKDSNKILKKVMYLASQIHSSIMYVQQVMDFDSEDQEFYEYLFKELSYQIMKISTIKMKYNINQNKMVTDTIKSINPEITKEEINNQIENLTFSADDDQYCDMFAQQIISDRYKREEANIALMYAKEQKKELMEIERSVARLNQMSIDLACIVNGQTDILNQLDESISSSVKYSGKGLQLLELAEKSKLSSRKKKIIAGVLIAVVVGVVVVTVVGIGVGVLCFCG